MNLNRRDPACDQNPPGPRLPVRHCNRAHLNPIMTAPAETPHSKPLLLFECVMPQVGELVLNTIRLEVLPYLGMAEARVVLIVPH